MTEFEADLLALHLRHAALEAEAAILRLTLTERRREAKYDPNQPRVPRGSPEGGQWTDFGGAVAGLVERRPNDGGVWTERQPSRWILAADRRELIDLRDEEGGAHFGHTIKAHVGRSGASLIARVRGERYYGLTVNAGRKRDGSFSSIEAANKLVNSTIDRNRAEVAEVASGAKKFALLTAKFNSVTGIEAYYPGLRPGMAPKRNQTPTLRTTYGVGVFIVHDQRSPKGYHVVTAYPRDDDD